MKINTLVLTLLIISASFAQQKNDPASAIENGHNWEQLIDTDLSKWDTYLSYQIQPGYDGTQPKDEQGELVEPIGLNNPVLSSLYNDEGG